MCFFFFFSSRRRHTRSKRDWSSDVCSSDLASPADSGLVGGRRAAGARLPPTNPLSAGDAVAPGGRHRPRGSGARCDGTRRAWIEIGRASCRERGQVGEVAGREERKEEEREL